MKQRSSKAVELTVQDFYHRPKNNFWFVGIGVLAVAAGYLAVSAHDYLMLAVVVAVVIALFRVAGLRPASRAVRINSHGLSWGNQFFAYHQLKAFWLSGGDDAVTIHLERPNAALSLSFLVPLDQAEPITKALIDHLPYHHHRGEPVGERFARLLHL